MKIRKGDTVKIISGNDRGKTGVVRAAFPRDGRIIVEGIYMKKKHVRPRRQGARGELVRIPAPFPVSRVMLVCRTCGKRTRIARRLERGRSVRVCVRCGTMI